MQLNSNIHYNLHYIKYYIKCPLVFKIESTRQWWSQILAKHKDLYWGP